MPFGIDVGEFLLIFLIVMVVFGSTKLPQDYLGRWLRGERSFESPSAGVGPRPWSKWDRVLVISIWVLGAAALALLVRRHWIAG